MKQTTVKIGLKFPPDKANKPVVAELVGFGLDFNILRAFISPGKTGHLVLEMTGKESDVQKGIEFLKREGIVVTVFTDSVVRYEEKCMHCGACTFNRRAMLARILRCREAGVPITNYGLVIAYSLGIFERALAPFPAALEVYRQALRGDGHGQPAAVTAGLPDDVAVDELC
jgi:hypothetical protein